MIRISFAAVRLSAVVACVASVTGSSVWAADSKENSCRYQGQVMAAVQQARLDRVKAADVADSIAATNPEWPDAYSNAIPQLAAHVYAMKRADLKTLELGAVFEEQCLNSWDQIQELQKQLQSN